MKRDWQTKIARTVVKVCTRKVAIGKSLEGVIPKSFLSN